MEYIPAVWSFQGQEVARLTLDGELIVKDKDKFKEILLHQRDESSISIPGM